MKELQDFGKMTAPMTKETPRYKLKNLFAYCKRKNIEPKELTHEEREKFLVER